MVSQPMILDYLWLLFFLNCCLDKLTLSRCSRRELFKVSAFIINVYDPALRLPPTQRYSVLKRCAITVRT